MNQPRAIVLALVLIGLVPLLSRADEIVFKNGDKLSGKNATLEGTKITMESAVAGKVTVDLKDVATFSSSEPIDVVLNNGTTIHEKVNTGPDGQITLTPPAGAPMVIALADVKKLNPPSQKWSGNVVIGGLLARGNTDSDSFNASADFVRRTDQDRLTLSGSYIYGRQSFPGGGKHETADDLLGQAKYDYFLTPKFYATGSIKAEHDVIAGISVLLAPNAGIGYQWFDDPTLSFNTEIGAGYLYRKYSHDGHTGAADARAAYHLKVKFNEKVSGFHDFEYLPGLDRITNYFFDTDAGIRANFTDKFFTEFKVDYRYDSRPAPGKGASDIRYILGVGWAFSRVLALSPMPATVFIVRLSAEEYISHTLSPTAECRITKCPRAIRRQTWAAVGVAVALAAPLIQPPSCPGQPAATQPSDSHLPDAKTAYELGIREYHAENWAAARKYLQIARDSGYRPNSIFQDPPAVILKRMDLRDQSGRQRVQKLAESPQTQPDQNGRIDPLAALRATDEARQVRHQEALHQADEWVRQATAAKGAQKYEMALDLYRKAIDLDPSNNAAVQGRDQVLSILGRNPSPADLVSEESHTIEARRGEIRYNVQSNLDRATAAIAQKNWTDAQIAIDRARLAASADPSIFKPQETSAFQNSIDQADLQLHQEQERQHQRAEQLRDFQVQKRLEEQRKKAIEERQRTVADLIHTAQLLDSQGRFREALQTVDQILLLDPINDFAVGARPLLEDKTQFGEQRDFTERRDRAIARQLNSAEEKQIPYDDVLRYPVDWPDISATRDDWLAAEQSGSTGDRAIETALSRTIPEVQFDNVAFSDVVDFLRDVSGLNIFVNWKTLEAAGIEKTTTVTARLKNVKFSKALDIILNESVGGGQTKLGYTVDQGVITISTADDLAKNVVVRVYDIRDLILNVPDFNNAPNFSLESAQNSGNSSSGGGSGQGGVTQGGASNTLFSGTGQTQQQNVGPTRQELVDAITKLVEDTVASDSWKDNGGSTGALRELQGSLIVTQTPENQRQLVALLEKLRRTRALQISIEARFLTVQRNFMEDVGLDLNFLFDLNSAWSKNFGTIPLTTPNSTFTMNPSTGVQGSIGGATTPPTGLTTSVAYLDDFSAQMTMRAVEASANSTLVVAPRLTLFNGQRAYVLVAIQRAYISNLTPVVTTGATSFAPTVSIVQSGVLLDVEATVSADRKYVTMNLRPQLATLLDLANFTFQVGSNANNGVIRTGGIITNVQNSPTGTIQEPELQITQVYTTASVPDGGTLLVGGQTVAGETEREIGAPGPSEIPLINRLFTNRSVAKDEQVLLILIKPTIVVQNEIEQKQFPLLTSKLNGS